MRAGAQRGQAIVLMALLFAVMCGMLAISVDAGRGYVARRSIQNAADASADAGAATYARTLDFTLAEPAQLQKYEDNRGLSGGTCSPGWQAPPAGGTIGFHCTFTSDTSQDAAIAVTDRSDVGEYQFWTGGQNRLSTVLIQVVGGGPTFPIAAEGVSWYATTGYQSGSYGFGNPPPGGGTYGSPPSGWTGPWPPGSGDSGSPPPGWSGPWPPPGGGTGCVVSCGGGCSAYCTAGSIPPVVLALSGACGGGSGDALTIKGLATAAAVVGNVVSYGDAEGNVQGGGGSPVPVAADTTAYCKAPTGITGWCYPSGLAPGTGGCTGGSVYQYGKPQPPSYQLSPVNGNLSTGTPGTSVNVEPGVYPTPALFGGGSSKSCTFMAGGVYTFQSSLTDSGGVVSNELRPPDEPATGSVNPTTTIQSPEFWNQNGAQCAGSYGISTVLDIPGPGLPPPANGLPLGIGAYAVRVTSVRQDNGYTRESSPSICRSLSLAASAALQISVSNVPGAVAYNVYLSTVSINSALTGIGLPPGTPGGTCAGPFYLLGQIPVTNPQLETNANTSGCPSLTQTPTCSLGVTVGAFDQTQLNQILTAITTAALPPPLSLPKPPCVAAIASNCLLMNLPELRAPAGSGLADQDALINTDPANWGLCAYPNQNKEHACENTAAGFNPNDYDTPGAVQIQETNAGSCFDFSSGSSQTPSGPLAYLFSGYQYAWALILQPTADGSCSDYFAPKSGSEFFGHVWVPLATAYVAGNNAYVPFIYGTFTAYQIVMDATQGMAVYFVPPPSNPNGYGIPQQI